MLTIFRDYFVLKLVSNRPSNEVVKPVPIDHLKVKTLLNLTQEKELESRLEFSEV